MLTVLSDAPQVAWLNTPALLIGSGQNAPIPLPDMPDP